MLSWCTAYRCTAAFAGALVALAALAPACWAQNAAQTDPGFDFVTDVIVGHNKKGPYTLSYTNIDLDTLSVVINGRSLKRGDDFNIDPAKGMLSFNSVLVNDAIVRASYRIIPGKSQKNAAKLSVPVSLNIFQTQDSSMQVTGLFAQDDPKNPNAGKTVIGVGGERKWVGSKLNSLFLVSQRSEDKAAESQGSMWDRAGLKLGGDTGFGALKLSASYLHSGKEFGGAKEYGLGLGQELRDISLQYAPGAALQATATYQEKSDEVKKTRSLLNEQSIVYSPADSTELSFVHSVKETGAPGVAKSVDSNLIKLGHDFGGGTTAEAAIESASVTTGVLSDQIRSRRLQLASTRFRNISLRSLITQKHSELAGEEQGFSFGITAKPTEQVDVAVDVATLENETVGQQTRTDVVVSAGPIKNIGVSASYSGVDSSRLGENTKTSLSVQASPLKNVQLQSSFLGANQNEKDQFQRDFSLTSTPTPYSKLTALFSQKGINDWDDVTRGAVLELTALSHTQVSAGYRYIESGPQVLVIRDYAAVTKPWSFFNASASIRDRQHKAGDAPDTASVNFSLAPVRYFTLTGDYQQNPEDKKGIVQAHKSTAVGLATHIGSIGVRTGFASKDEYMAGRLSEERDVGIELPAFGSGILTTGYKVSRLLDGSDCSSRSYLLGYRHALGSDFSLLLSGCYTQHLQNSMLLPEETEVSATASLGMRF